MAEQSTYRTVILAETLKFVKQACKLNGIKRISLIGSLTREKSYPKDVDLLIRVTDEADLAPLAKMARQLSGRLQDKRNSTGVDAFLATPRGKYLGRTCPWRICEPRGNCDAFNCAKRLHLHDDFEDIKLKRDLILRPPVDLWPKIVRREVLPQDTEDILVQPLEIMIREKKNKKVSLSWESTEKIVALIEQAISPEAKVEHNVKLPVIGSHNRESRQCDVVITFGKPPRQTIAIVEVQRRKTKPDITTFHGWCEKMKEVGAQQFFCVSQLGYPKSIIEDVKIKRGPTVKLLTLKDLENNKVLGGFFPSPDLIFTNPEFEIIDLGTPQFIPVNDSTNDQKNNDLDDTKWKIKEINLDGNSPKFYCDNQTDPISFHNILNKILQTKKDIVFPFSGRVNINLDDYFSDIYYYQDECKIIIKKWILNLNINYSPEKISIPFSHFIYREVFINDALAWIGTSQFEYQGEKRDIKIFVSPNGDNSLTIAVQSDPCHPQAILMINHY